MQAVATKDLPNARHKVKEKHSRLAMPLPLGKMRPTEAPGSRMATGVRGGAKVRKRWGRKTPFHMGTNKVPPTTLNPMPEFL